MASRQQEQDTVNRDGLDEDDERQEIGYLETLKGKFSFDQLPNRIQFIDCQVKNGVIDGVFKFINKIWA